MAWRDRQCLVLEALLLGLGCKSYLSLGGGTGLGLTEVDAVVLLVPLTEGGGIDLDDGALHEGVRAHQLVVRGVVDDTEDPRLTGDSLRGPGVVAGLETQSAVLDAATTASDGVNPLGAELGKRRGATELELPLLAVDLTLATGGAPLVLRITGDT